MTQTELQKLTPAQRCNYKVKTLFRLMDSKNLDTDYADAIHPEKIQQIEKISKLLLTDRAVAARAKKKGRKYNGYRPQYRYPNPKYIQRSERRKPGAE